MSVVDHETTDIERLALLAIISIAFSLFPGAVVWLLTHNPIHGLEAACSFAFMFALLVGLSFLANKFLPASIAKRVKRSRPRNLLLLLILSAVSLPVVFGWTLPLVGHRYAALIGLVLILAVIFVPTPKRRTRISSPADSLHASN